MGLLVDTKHPAYDLKRLARRCDEAREETCRRLCEAAHADIGLCTK